MFTLRTTPKTVKILIWTTTIVTLLCPIVTFIFNHFLHQAGPSQWFSLHVTGLLQGFLWQPFTYFFIYTAGTEISFQLLSTLTFYMFLLWFAGSEIGHRYSSSKFLLLYLSAGSISGIFTALFMFFFSLQEVVFGSAPAVYACLIVMTMLYPNLQLAFLKLLRMRVKTALIIFLGVMLLIALSKGHFAYFLAESLGIIYGWVIGRLIYKLPNPYPIKWKWRKKAPPKHAEKIIDITVIHEDDTDFMNRMLDKISAHGEASLTKREKERMQRISKGGFER